MIEGSLSRRYAKALFQLALEQRREEEVGQEIERFLSLYTSSPLMSVLNNPAFSEPKRKNIVLEVAKQLKLPALVVHFLCLLLERRRLNFLPTAVARYRRLLDELKGRVEAVVVSPAPLEEEALDRLRAALNKISGKEVLLKPKTDARLMGGVMIQLEGKIYDGSVRAQLEKMRERIERGW